MYLPVFTVILTIFGHVDCKQFMLVDGLLPIGCAPFPTRVETAHSEIQCAGLCEHSCKEFSFDGEKNKCYLTDGTVNHISTSRNVFRSLEDYTYNSHFALWYRIGIIDNKQTWRQSRTLCECERGHMFEVRNQEIYDWLGSIVVYAGSNNMHHYIDGTDESSAGVWKNRYGEPLWIAPDMQQENHGGNQHCVTIMHKPGGTPILMNDYDCDSINPNHLLRYVCEL